MGHNYTGDQLVMLGMGFLWGSNPTNLILSDDNQHDGAPSCIQIMSPGFDSVIMCALSSLSAHNNANLEINYDCGIINVRGINRRSYFYMGLRRKMVIWMENVCGDKAQAFIEGFDTAQSINSDQNSLKSRQQLIVDRIRNNINKTEEEINQDSELEEEE